MHEPPAIDEHERPEHPPLLDHDGPDDPDDDDPGDGDGGDGDDFQPSFSYWATLRISAERLDLEEITRQLGLTPTRLYRRGDLRDGVLKPRRYDLWAYQAPVTPKQPLAEHVDTLWAHIRHAAPFLRELKQIATVEVLLGYRSDWCCAGFEVPLASLAMFAELGIGFKVTIIVR
ncbi:MAG TPA: DUF4279 domain-containing protein [Roseiflexaceae bacterium]|nr:DUF4279 domain-containing protein [Roseiflexaceae bacterium]